MIELFGAEYAEEFLSHTEKMISETQSEIVIKKYQKTIKDVESMLENMKNQNNSI